MNTESHTNIANELKWRLNVLIVAVVVLFLALSGIVYSVFSAANQNKKALCAYRADLEGRIKTSQDFIVAHPQGFAGITVKELQTSITSQQHAVKAFQKIKC